MGGGGGVAIIIVPRVDSKKSTELCGRFKPRLRSHCVTDARELLWFYHTLQAAMLLCKHTVGGVTVLNEIHTAHLHHSVMIATCTWLVSTRATASHDATITVHKRNTNIQEFCTLLNPLLIVDKV